MGRPTIAHNVPAAVVAVFSLTFVLAAILFLVFGEYTRRVRVSGVVLPIDGLTRLVAPQAGWVTGLKVKEGQNVRRGDILYSLSIDSTTALGNTQDAVAEVLRIKRNELHAASIRQLEVDKVEKKTLQDQLSDIGREIVQVDSQIELLEEFTATMKEFAERQQKLVSKGVSISRDYESRLQAYNSQRSQLETLRRDRIQLAARLTESRNQLSGFDLQAAARSAEIRRQRLDIEQQISESEAKRELQITAPRDGAVTGIITLAGQTVSAGTPLLTIVPRDRPLVVQLLAPSNAIGFVREGSSVLLRYEAFPYQKFGQHPGAVSLISRATLRPEEVAQLNAGDVDPQRSPSLYRITVQPEHPFVTAYGREEALQVGMQVEAHVLAETRPLYQWVLEPIYGLRGSVAAAGEQG
ncbi:HlyD family efflux transporter periplasmic adaptor subunit [Mesorhizobium sp.]|uniref:HlyD family secretion protein n=1 Tax=Mesorhizobium sp. TaxID=1871066 RepID=UPI0025C57464|nr:HlyD family efflux transporter periplasmic adaptor subunit [Mesorhizobium sp.]